MNDRNSETSKYVWPRSGMGAGEILGMPHHVMIDGKLFTEKGIVNFLNGSYQILVKSASCIHVQFMDAVAARTVENLMIVKAGVYSSFDACCMEMKRVGGTWIYITNNNENAEKIREAAHKCRVYVRVYGLDDDGLLLNYRPQTGIVCRDKVSDGRRANRNVSTVNDGTRRETGNRTIEGAFRLTQQICAIKRTSYQGVSVPSKMDYVFDSHRQRIQLLEEFISNPQSITYNTSLAGMQAKIYQKSWLQLSYFEDKAGKMISNPVEMDGICWPKDMLYDENGAFVGILVPQTEGFQLKQDLMSQTGLKNHFPDWDRRDLTHLTVVILEKIVYLQKRNVIFGLINPGAIFVKDKDHVYFAEMDTYQIEGYPILSYERVMQAPELQDAENELRLYSKQQDNYGIALLIFMILMPGKFPYNKGKHKNISDSIKEMAFAFNYGKKQGTEHGVREYFGLWRFVWSHLGNDLKQAFYYTFQKGQPYSAPAARKNASFWLNRVKNLESELEHPYDEESCKLFPRTFKRYSGTETIQCVKCGIEHPTFYYRYPEKKICNSCLGQPSDTHFECRTCHRTYYYDFSTLFKYERLVEQRNFSMPTHCPYCRMDKEKCKGPCGKIVPSYRLNKDGLCPDCASLVRNRIVKRYPCCGCGKMIELTQGQIDSFNERSYSLPKRCKQCKEKQRNGRY